MVFSPEQSERYSRHFVLKEIGVEGQEKLLLSRVLVVGAGALGSAALMYLAAAGVGTLGIVDGDQVELSNLQRQIIHRTQNAGERKVDSAKRTIGELNPDIRVNIYPHRATPDNIEALVSDYDFIIDATDSFASKLLINDACVLAGKPFAHAGIVRFGGQAMTYVPGKGPCLRCLVGSVPEQDGESCSQVGVLGAATGILGSVEALEAVKYLLGIGELLTGRILFFEGLTMDFSLMKIPEAVPQCAVCGNHAGIHSVRENRAEYERVLSV